MDNKTSIPAQLEEIRIKIDELDGSIKRLNKISSIKDIWIDSDDVCFALNISKRTLRNYVKQGIFKTSLVGGRIFFKTLDILDYLEKNHRYHQDYAKNK